MITTSSQWTTILFRASSSRFADWLLQDAPPLRRRRRQPSDPSMRRSLTRAARRIEPELQGDPGRLDQYLDAFRRELTDDPRLVACEVGRGRWRRRRSHRRLGRISRDARAPRRVLHGARLRRRRQPDRDVCPTPPSATSSFGFVKSRTRSASKSPTSAPPSAPTACWASRCFCSAK